MDSYQVEDDWEGARGRNESAVLSPADVFAFSDTHDRTWYTNAMNTGLSMWTGTRNRDLIHGGRLNMNYLDGHAKNMQWHVGMVRARPFGPGVPYLFPKNKNDYAKWCANPDETISVPSGIRGFTLPCGQVAAYFEGRVRSWADD